VPCAGEIEPPESGSDRAVFEESLHRVLARRPLVAVKENAGVGDRVHPGFVDLTRPVSTCSNGAPPRKLVKEVVSELASKALRWSMEIICELDDVPPPPLLT
jgi:hypothetical protein